MDNWGDPWADNAKSPTKSAVTLPAFAPAPVPALLNGFLDDAGWGNDEESFGDWAADTGEYTQRVGGESSAAASKSSPDVEDSASDTPWDIAEKEEALLPRHDDDWAAATSAFSRVDHEKVPSEASDSSTTIHADDAADDVVPDSPAHTQPVDDSSARASTSPSEGSHNEVPAESPRTSYEEESGAGRVLAETVSSETHVADETGKSEAVLPNGSGDDQVTHDNAGEMHLQDASGLTDGANDLPVAAINGASSPTTSSAAHDSSTSVLAGAYVADPDLLAQLLPLQQEVNEPNEAPEDPIYSTSARKAWYRLTRKQTLREFRHGHDDDNYIRVTWTNSGIKEEVNTIVGRWAREDRISGTGPGARASFYWDTPASTDSKLPSMHAHQKSMPDTVAPKRVAPPPLSANSPAAFDWSSPVVDPRQQSSPGLRSVSSPVASTQSTLTKVRAPESRTGSLDLAQFNAESSIRGRMVVAADETPAVATLISPPISNIPTSFSDPWAGLDSLDTIAPEKEEKSSALVDEEVDDDWGEMVSSPITSTPTKTETIAHVEPSSAPSTSTPTPFTAKGSPLRDSSPDAMHASSIVRLRGVISPTSAAFKAKSFVPLSVEHGPIGPGLLKAVNRSTSSTSRKAEAVDIQPVNPQNVVESQASNVGVQEDEVDDFSSRVSAVPEALLIEGQVSSKIAAPPSTAELSRPSTPVTAVPAPIPIDSHTTGFSNPVESLTSPLGDFMPPTLVKATSQSITDSWADADFSIFESSIPVAPPQSKQQALDSSPVFDSRSRTTSSVSSARSFTRSPPRNVATSSPQPLTAATNSAQRRKAEEDGIIAEIVGGLSDLGYMLR